MRRALSFLLFSILATGARAQPDSMRWSPDAAPHFGFINNEQNIIDKPGQLDSFFAKLVQLRATHKGRVNIVHIGDSHLQADGITRVVRDGFHSGFGDAGRGLVFPHQLAGSNAPRDVASSSNVSWKGGKLTNPDVRLKTGIAGYYIENDKRGAAVRIALKEIDGRQDYFDRMCFFLGPERDSYSLRDSALENPAALATFADADTPSVVFESPVRLHSFELSKSELDNDFSYHFYGVSLEKKNVSGVLYHMIGVNGARYDQYLENNTFWRQLSALDGDLFIVSLGTNEAQNMGLTEQGFEATVDSMVRRIKQIAPKACILLTTPAGSFYRRRKPNPCMPRVVNAIGNYSTHKNVAVWDLYEISAGKNSAIGWKKAGMLGHDLVHYTPQGYQLQGALLTNALARAYNNYAKLHPYKPEPPKPRPTIVQPVQPTPAPQPAPARPEAAKASNKPPATAQPAVPKPIAPVVTTAPTPTPIQDSVAAPTPQPTSKNLKVIYLEK